MSDREVVVTYAIRAGSGNRGVYERIAKGAADIQNAYTRAGEAAAQQAEKMARRIETAYASAARAIAGSVSRRATAAGPFSVMPMSPQQQAMARAQANGGTGVSQFMEDMPSVPRAGDAARARAAKTVKTTKSTPEQLVDDSVLARWRDRRMKEEEKLQKDLNTVVSRGVAQRTGEEKKAITEVRKAREKAAKDAEKAEEAAFSKAQQQSRKTVADEAKAAKDQERSVIQQAAKAEQRRERFSGGARKAFQGAVSVAEGVAYLGLSSEEDTQKLIEGVMKVRGAAMGLVGVVDIVDGVMRAMSAVRAISVAGTAAEVALAAARSKTATATGAAAVAERGGMLAKLGGLLGLGGAGGAGGAGFGAAGIGAVGAGSGALLSVLAAGGMATNAFGMRDKTAAWMSGATREVNEFGVKRRVSNIGEYGENRSWSEWIGGQANWVFGGRGFGKGATAEDWDATQATNETKRRESLAAQQAARRTAEQEYGPQIAQIQREREFMNLDRSMRTAGMTAGRGITDPAQRELAESQARRREFVKAEDKSRADLDRLRQQQSRFAAGGLGEAVSPDAIVEAEKKRLAYLQRGLEIRRQEYDAQKRVNDEAIAGAQRAIGILQQRKGMYAQQAEGLRQEYRTGAEAWGTMDTAQREAARKLKERFDRGEDIGATQEQELMNLPISSQMRERIRKRQRDRGEREGYAAFAGGEITDRIGALDRTQAGIQRRIDVRQEVIVKIERDDQVLLEKFRAEASQVEDQVAGLVAADMNRSLEALGNKIVQAMNQALSRTGSQASAKIEAQAAQRGAAGAN